ncbi:MAG TPA: APC family permease, partial [Terriglobales bacterium]|nr:APC family permease [Terriglobales bacterium]
TTRLSPREHSFSGNRVYEAPEVFESYEQELFSRVVAVAEKQGKSVSLLVVPGTNVFDAIMVTAQRLESARIVCGLSTRLTADEQGKLLGDAWERLPEPKPRVTLEVISPSGDRSEYMLGPHAPRLREQDVEALHKLWLEITRDPRFSGIHHYDIFALALRELQREVGTARGAELFRELLQQTERRDEPRNSS